MYCLTGLDENSKPVDMFVSGRDETVPHTRLNIVFRPCVPPPELTDLNRNQPCAVDRKDPKAMADKLQQIKNYIGSSELVYIIN